MKKIFSIILFTFTLLYVSLSLNKSFFYNKQDFFSVTSKNMLSSTKKISAGGSTSALIFENNLNGNDTFYIWGGNYLGNLGNGSFFEETLPIPIDVDGDGIIGNEKIIDFYIESRNSSAILDNGNGTTSLYMWGDNLYGQIGDGTQVQRNIPTKIDVDGDGIKGNEKIIDVNLGEYHSSALLDNGDGTQSLYMWGKNNYGQLGMGFANSSIVLKPKKIDIDNKPGGEKILGVSLGYNHSSVVVDNGNYTQSLYVWGNNFYGQLGDGSVGNDIYEPTVLDIDGDGTPGNEKIKNFSFDYNHSLAILEENTSGDSIYAWGDNRKNQINSSSSSKISTPYLIDLNNNGNPYEDEISNVALGENNSAVLTSEPDGNNTLYIWGSNLRGQLADGTFDNSLYPKAIDVDNSGTPGDEKIKDVDFGQNHVLALLENNQLYGWGQNGIGELGIGEYGDRNKPVLVDFGYNFIFDIISKNQSSFIFEFNTNLSITEADKKNILLYDDKNQSYSAVYDNVSQYTVSGLESGKNYFFKNIDINGNVYSINNFLNVLIDYEINGIKDWNSTSTTAEINLDILAKNFGAFSTDERTIQIEYNFSPISSKQKVKNITSDIVIDNGGKIYFSNLETASVYEITKISYNKVSSGSFKYEKIIDDNNLITTLVDGLFLDNKTFKINSVGSTTIKFSINVSDSGNEFFKYDYVYLFFKNVKGGESPILAYKNNLDQTGSGKYEFYVKNLSSDTKYEFVGISIDRIMSLNDQGLEEKFNESYIIRTKPNFKTAYLYLIAILILIIILILVVLFFVYKSALTYKKMQESMDGWYNLKY